MPIILRTPFALYSLHVPVVSRGRGNGQTVKRPLGFFDFRNVGVVLLSYGRWRSKIEDTFLMFMQCRWQ